MAFIDPALVMEGVRLVARQTTSTLLSASQTTPTSIITSTTSSGPPADTSVNNNQGSPNGNNQQNNSPTGQSSPLLFFVALGFGVVFTNLWIIVGVKYCFRYNARNRQMRVNEDGEPITLENMPRPHRRRREKKLMTMDEVNEKFPMQKYKNWVASRAQEGLPTRGGVSVPPSRANSVRSVQGVMPEISAKERVSSDERPTTSATTKNNNASEDAMDKPAVKHVTKESTSSATLAEATEATATAKPSTEQNQTPSSQPEKATTTTDAEAKKVTSRSSDDHGSFEEEEDEHINAALPPELMGTSGDTCAICIDSLEDDDDVRGLTCGHAFHAVCLDPWLTSRRACCPLCKADYYTPKPRPSPPEGAIPTDGARTTGVVAVTLPENGRGNIPRRPQNAWTSIRDRMFGGSDQHQQQQQQQQQHHHDHPRRRSEANGPSGSGNSGILSRFRSGGANVPSPAHAGARQNTYVVQSEGGFFRNLRAQYVPFRPRPRTTAAGQSGDEMPMASGANPGATPSQLEAGTAPAR